MYINIISIYILYYIYVYYIYYILYIIFIYIILYIYIIDIYYIYMPKNDAGRARHGFFHSFDNWIPGFSNKTVASRAWSQSHETETAKSVASRECWKLHKNVKRVASRACWTFTWKRQGLSMNKCMCTCKWTLLFHPAPPKPPTTSNVVQYMCVCRWTLLPHLTNPPNL